MEEMYVVLCMRICVEKTTSKFFGHKMFLYPKYSVQIFLTQNFQCPKFLGTKFFVPENVFDLKKFWTQNF